MKPTLLLICLAMSAIASAGPIVLSFDTTQNRVDLATGQHRDLPPIPGAMQGSAIASDGTVYVATTTGSVYRYDPGTGATTLVGSNGLNMRALTCVGTTLYAIVDGSSFSAPDKFYSINTSTAAASLIGTCNHAALQGMATSPNGTVYAFDIAPGTHSGLVTVNVATGATTDVFPAVGDLGTALQSLEFDAYGFLWGASQTSLYRIDLATGTPRLIMTNIGSDVRAMVFPRTIGRALALDGSARMWSIDLGTGAGYRITSGTVANASFTSMPDGRIWTESTNHIANIDPGNGSKVVLSTAVEAVAALASTGGVLYGVRSVGLQSLNSYNLVTGAPTTIGSTGRTSTIVSMTADSAGTLYAWDTALGLMTIDKATGAATDVSAGTGADSRISTIEFGTDGTLFGGGSALYVLSKTTGAVVRTIGSGGYASLRGMAIMPLNGRAFGVDNSGELYQLDLDLITSSVLDSSTLSVVGMTSWPEGPASVGDNTGGTRVKEINTVAGNFVTGSMFTVPSGNSIDALFMSNHKMYVLNDINATQSLIRGFDYRDGSLLSTATTTTTSTISEGASTPDGGLFGYSTTDGLMQIDPITGGTFSVDPAPPGGNQFGMMVLPDGRAYASGGPGLHRLNLTNGDLSSLGSIGFNVRGLTWTSRRVHGGAILADWLAPYSQTEVEIEVRHPGSLEVVESTVVYPMGIANIEFGSNLFGTYDIAIKPKHWLRVVYPNVLITSSGALYGSGTYVNGDSDNDNQITIGDYSLLSIAFNSLEGDPNWDPMADLNGDLAVDIGDYAILSANFGQIGDD